MSHILLNVKGLNIKKLMLQQDPRLRKPIWMYDVNQQDEVRRAYIDMGAYIDVFFMKFLTYHFDLIITKKNFV